MDTESLYQSYLMRFPKEPAVSLKEFSRQLELEQEAIEGGQLRYIKGLCGRTFVDTPTGKTMMARTLERMVEALKGELPSWERKWSQTTVLLHKLDLWELAALTTSVAFRCAYGDVSHSYVRACRELSDAVMLQVGYGTFRQERPGHLRIIIDSLKSESQVHRARVLNWYFGKFHTRVSIDHPSRMAMAARLINLLMETTGLLELWTENNAHRLKFTEAATRGILKNQQWQAHADPQCLPMVIPPLPWADMKSGGFILNGIAIDAPFVRSSAKTLALVPLANVAGAMEVASLLQETPWSINPFILAVAREALENGGIPGATPNMDTIGPPPKPWEDRGGAPVPEELKAWKTEAALAYHEEYCEASRRMSFDRQTKLGTRLLGMAPFYYVWSCDFRGRYYPVQAWINPQSDDFGKALLKFHTSVPLTPLGQVALKIHLANEFGHDKGSYADRLQWVDGVAPLFAQTLAAPMDNRWWTQAEHPWMFLAAMKELHSVPIGSPSSLPVFADGSCNGFQHLSALLRDPVGGQEVNLTSARGSFATRAHSRSPHDPASDLLSLEETPGDIYSRVVEHLRPYVETSESLRDSWLPHLDRKLVKRGVMTSPYSVTRIGMALQLMNEMASRGVTSKTMRQDCAVLAGLIEAARDGALAQAMGAMRWLKEVARACNKLKNPLLWDVPHGFRVIQYYLKYQMKRINLYLGAQRFRMQLNAKPAGLNTAKQLLGIAPNFIHSYDACHLSMTVKAASAQGIPAFAMVHDSYGCHASHMPLLGRVLREEFVRLYTSADQLEVLKRNTEERLGVPLPPVPPKGSLEIADVLTSPHFFNNVALKSTQGEPLG